MASSNQTPDVLFSPIAANADASDINTIPQTYDPANYGYAAQNVGFPTECRLPVLNPDGTLGQGRAPRMQDWNGIMKLVSSHNFFLQNGGSYTFNPTVSSNIGGYPKNAVLWYFPENEAPCLVYSLINDNTNNFVDDPTLIDGIHWEMLVNPSSYANIALTNSPYTTNRILEIPQDIKLKLSNGTLTLKAGSKVYVPNGFETDGTTPKFDVVTIGSDLSTTGYHDGQIMIFAQCSSLSSTSINAITEVLVSNAKSGTSPEESVYYNTSLNMIYRYTSSTEYDLRFDLPVAICTRTDGIITSIDQIFNGFGYIGSTVFALPGVKVQIPNGRNEDGTCKSVYGVIRTVQQTSINPGDGDFSIRIGDNFIAVGKFVYDGYTNYNYNQTVSPSNIRYQTNAGTVSYSSGKITSFEPYTVDSVLNSNLSNLSATGQAKFDAKADINLSNLNNTGNAAASNLNSKGIRTVVETYRNGTNWYRVFSDGWIEQGGFSPNGSYIVTFLKPFTDASYTALCTFQDSYSSNSLAIKDRTNTSFTINRGTAATDIGSKAWYACGY